MEVYRVKTGSILPLGKQGENRARQIRFDISSWMDNFGPGTVQLLHQRRGDEAPYPVAVEKDGTQAIWTVTNADTAAAGTGRAELQYYVGDALAKSETWMTKVLSALGPASETPPEAQQGWVDQVLAQVARITGMTAQAVELPAGSAPMADYADGVLTIGIPLGGDVSEAQIAQAVAEYLSNNPIAETDPTVPDWAKEEKKPSYTAAEVGADPSGTAESKVAAHNTGTDTHSDIRLLIQGLTERLNTLADSDDTTLDQLSEIVSYIKSNRSLIEAITTSKVSVADIIDNLTTNAANKPLSAAQGVAIKALIDAITIPNALPNPNALTFTGAVTGSYDGSAPLSVEIPSGGSAYELPVASATQLGGVMPVAKTDEMTQAVGVDAEGGLWALPGGGSMKMELLAELHGDGEGISFSATFDGIEKPGLYLIHFMVDGADAENTGNSLYAKFGGSGIWGNGVRSCDIATTNNQYDHKGLIMLITTDGLGNAYVASGAERGLNDSVGMYDSGNVIIDGVVSLYSQKSKPVFSGASVKLWRLL